MPTASLSTAVESASSTTFRSSSDFASSSSSRAAFSSSSEPPSSSASFQGSGSFSGTISQSFSRKAVSRNATSITHFPLTTIFTPPPRCTDIPLTFSTAASGLSTFWRNANGPGQGSESACYPYSFAYQQRTTVSADYSPGVCPAGYEAATSAENRRRGAHTSWCCPSEFSYALGYGCFSTVTTPTVVMLNSQTNITMATPFVAADWYIKVAWATSQLNLFTPASAPLLAAPSATSSGYTGPAMSDQARQDLGISVPVGVVTIAVLAAACYAVWRRRRRQPRDTGLLGEDEREKQLSVAYQKQMRYDSCQAQELSADTRVPETDPLGFVIERQDSMQIDETQPATEPR